MGPFYPKEFEFTTINSTIKPMSMNTTTRRWVLGGILLGLIFAPKGLIASSRFMVDENNPVSVNGNTLTVPIIFQNSGLKETTAKFYLHRRIPSDRVLRVMEGLSIGPVVMSGANGSVDLSIPLDALTQYNGGQAVPAGDTFHLACVYLSLAEHTWGTGASGKCVQTSFQMPVTPTPASVSPPRPAAAGCRIFAPLIRPGWRFMPNRLMPKDRFIFRNLIHR